ncbi:MAG: chemotaxis protein CheW [Ancrocorticia sp.]|jgi:purine-binding chemotaxis protein CheW|nr:chemotaxis protein CheW [Ancrocorticia sp.]
MLRQFVTFTVDQYLYGIDVNNVQEVLPQRATTEVPLASDEIAGLVNLRGQVVLSIDLRARLGLGRTEELSHKMVVVVNRRKEPVSFVVDRIGDVVAVDESQFEAPPQTLQGELRSLVQGSYKLPDRLLLALDVESAMISAPA